MHIFFYEAFEEEQEAIKSFLPDHIEAGFTGKTIQEYGSEKPPAPIISVRTQSALPKEWAPDLDAIISRSTGYDHLTDYLKVIESPVACGNLPLYCNRAVAEQAMLTWMMLLRNFTQQQRDFKTFHRDGLTGRETLNKNLLVVGVGNIGSEVVKLGLALGMNVRCVDVVERYPDWEYVQKEDGMAWADVVVCAMNLTNDNHDYFTYNLFKKAKAGLLFVNISRGECSPSVTLLKLLTEEHLGGIALDVYNEEKYLSRVLRGGEQIDRPEVQATLTLAAHPQVICTPHNAFNTIEGVGRKSSQSVDQLLHFLEKGELLWKVE